MAETSLFSNSFQIYGLDSAASYGYYDVSFYPTRYNQSLPADITHAEYIHSLVIHLDSVSCGCDSSTADFAFKVVEQGSGHRMSPYHQPEVKEEKAINSFKVFPNPTLGQFSVVMPFKEGQLQEYDLFIYNITGQLAYEQRKLKENVFSLDLTGYPKGVYFIKTLLNGEIMYNKIIIQ
jgi:hypothetical protein